MPATRQRGSTDIYGDVNSPSNIRAINRQIRAEMDGVRSRQELTELKKRADYLCALAVAPSWKEKFGRKSGEILAIAKEEDRKSTEHANQVARRHGWDADYDPWGGGRNMVTTRRRSSTKSPTRRSTRGTTGGSARSRTGNTTRRATRSRAGSTMRSAARTATRAAGRTATRLRSASRGVMRAAGKTYRSSQSRYSGGGKTKYLTYRSTQPLRGGRSQMRTRVKRLYFPANARDIKMDVPGTHRRRTGSSTYGVAVNYKSQIGTTTARRGRTTFRISPRWVPRQKIVELPRGATGVRLMDRAPEGPRMAVR